jgi:single-strand DNA-binding protein
MNQVCLTGRITKDIVLEKIGKNQTSKISFYVASTRDYKNENGEYDADFPRIVAWRGNADYLAKYAGKGTMIEVVGRLETGSYEKDGKKYYTTDVVASSVRIISGSKAKAEESEDDDLIDDQIDDNDFADIDIADEDMPF